VLLFSVLAAVVTSTEAGSRARRDGCRDHSGARLERRRDAVEADSGSAREIIAQDLDGVAHRAGRLHQFDERVRALQAADGRLTLVSCLAW
jgi:hypothetical protein